MKSKILALSKNEEFKSLLKKKKLTNKYVTIFFGSLENKDNKRLNISFSVKKKNWKCRLSQQNQKKIAVNYE